MRSRNGGVLLEVVNMYMGKIFNIKLSVVITFLLKQLSMKQMVIPIVQNKNGGKFMAQTSLSNMQEMEIMEAQLRECYGRVVYAHKTQEKCADICLSKLNTIKLFQIFL